MDIENVDPLLREATRKLPATDASKRLTRTLIRTATRFLPSARVEGVRVAEERIGGSRLRVYRPSVQRGDAGLLWIHGGGLVFGNPRQDEALCAETAADLGITVVSARYRFAPEHPFPAPLDDVQAAWAAVQAHADALGLRADRVVVGGESAGGGLAAALVQRLADEGGVQPIGQWLFAPMIDDRTAADRSLDTVDHWIWNNRANHYSWRSYLAAEPGGPDVPPFAAAARRADLAGLPPAFIAVGDIELFHAEDVDYAQRLASVGVPVQLEVVGGAPHGFENWARETAPAVALLERARAWLAATIAG
ncbi:alpha/beta hydrolase [Leifsonia aquatica]|uniref:alpha/beta hydrolase n=1 Tax=Leifsonia aquatica TaxID=144185 RepID=UPI000468B8C2|nr:alpha/beta hydrolase [Leifsonia aquatica]